MASGNYGLLDIRLLSTWLLGHCYPLTPNGRPEIIPPTSIPSQPSNSCSLIGQQSLREYYHPYAMLYLYSFQTHKNQYDLEKQGVVTYMLPVEAFATAIMFFDQQKLCLIARSFPSEALDCLISKGQRSNCSHMFLIAQHFIGPLDPLIATT